MLRPPSGVVVPDVLDAMEQAGRDARRRSLAWDLPQTVMSQQRPGRNNVRYLDFDWHHYDFLDDRGVGGVRFYYYPREIDVARIAAGLVREQYELLAKKFNYRPTSRVPYFLYNSHREFENTNVFQVDEDVLGVTSPLDLRMALPFWGEINLFRQVSTHEMTHQFQIQKMAERAAAAGVESPINRMPLWFTEGLAEYYSHDGVDLETDMFGRDILLNPRPDKGYAVPDFWDDSRPSYVYTYKLGQIRVAFLADQYGEAILQTIIDQSPRLSLGGPLSVFSEDEQQTFKGLVARVTREKPDAIAEHFGAWLRRRYLPGYLGTRQEPPAISQVDLEGEPDAFSAAPDGETLLYRSVERDNGRAHLFLADRRERKSAVEVVADGVPGIESLYPVLRSVSAVTGGQLTFIARNGPADTLFIVPYTRRKHGHHVELSLGTRREIELSGSGLIEAGDPAFAPDGKRIAFFGLDRLGRIDIWTADIKSGRTTRITQDPHAERDLNWSEESPATYGVPIMPGGGHDGTILFTSDETENRHFNLYALDPATGERHRLTNEPCDERAPYGLGPGRLVFASNAQGKMDLHLFDASTGTIKRITDFATGLTAPAPGPDGLMAVGFYGGQYRVFDVPAREFLALDERPAMVDPPKAAPDPPNEPIPENAPAYDPYTLNSWRLENGTAALGSSSFGQGALLFGDMLSDRNLLVQVGLYGSLQLTNALLFYFDKSGRQQYGVGIFHNFVERRDISPPSPLTDALFLQREFGAQGIWGYPFSSFARVQAHAAIEGVQRSFLYPINPSGSISNEVPLDAVRTWNSTTSGYDLQAEASVVIGLDDTRYAFPIGAIGGGSLLVELGGGYLPLRGAPYGWTSFDAQYHWKILSLAVFHLRLSGGDAGGTALGHQFWLSSYDSLRIYQAFDVRLIGSAFLVSNLNLDIPLDGLIRVAFLSTIKGVVGIDIGSVAPQANDLWASRTMCWVLGADLGLGPFELRVQFANAIDLGNGVPNRGWVPNISLQYAYF
jgi:hypothetical protein